MLRANWCGTPRGFRALPTPGGFRSASLPHGAAFQRDHVDASREMMRRPMDWRLPTAAVHPRYTVPHGFAGGIRMLPMGWHGVVGGRVTIGSAHPLPTFARRIACPGAGGS